MKIKLTKDQWRQIGENVGWTKPVVKAKKRKQRVKEVLIPETKRTNNAILSLDILNEE